MSPRTIALACLMLMTACGKQADADQKAPTKAAKKAPGSLPKTAVLPNSPHAAVKADVTNEAPVLVSAPGTFDLTVDGKQEHYKRIPRGQNRAVALPDQKVARVSIAGALSDEGWPNIRITLEHFRPDEAEYPQTFSSATKGEVEISARYQVSENRVYQIDHDKGADLEVTLDRYEGKNLSGSFSGKLAPTAAGLGDPIEVSGKFTVELGLRNVEPGPTAGDAKVEGDAKAGDAKAGDAKAGGDAKPAAEGADAKKPADDAAPAGSKKP